MPTLPIVADPALDLTLIREAQVPIERVWQALTTPELIMKWFCPKPWQTTACELDLRPGGRFFTTMESPEGESFSGESCVLEVVENQRLVWSAALLPGYRPKPTPTSDEPSHEFPFTAVIELSEKDGGTIYRATVVHGDAETCAKHDAMGFEMGWGAAFDQLVELVLRE